MSVEKTIRTVQNTDGKSAFEKLCGRKPNTVKSNIVDQIKYVSETDSSVKLNTSDYKEEIGSTILVREKTKWSKLKDQF